MCLKQMIDVDKILEEIDKLNCFDKQAIYDKIAPEVEGYDIKPDIDSFFEYYNVEQLISHVGESRVLSEMGKSDLIDALINKCINIADIEKLTDKLADYEREELFKSYGYVKEDEIEEDKETYPDVDGLLEELAQYVVSPDDIIDYLKKIPEEVRKEIIIQAVMRWIS